MSDNNQNISAARTLGVPNMSDEEARVFRRIFEMQLLPAVIEILGPANIDSQVSFHRRKSINIVTRTEVPSGLQQEIERAVAAKLGEDLRAKVTVDFYVGEVKRSSGCVQLERCSMVTLLFYDVLGAEGCSGHLGVV
ncbi:hypothetical protein NUW58_g1246 [Xylaria curta]|uniref:Uncharacterized protein n=1 Tax=Xylaria curta TaxID=42375 RepID=A0ACC1PL51_9PEZI|nr:hypothetical protein NUW58_g1246 [Xylaria curta]